MIQGTGSHVGKSVLVAALCRIFARRGVKVAPFKSQNMSNNSAVTPDEKELGRAQAVQAAACGLAPRTDFNPILLKPSGERHAQVVVNGEVTGTLEAGDFGQVRRRYAPAAEAAFRRLEQEFDLIILEGAGSPAEVNLRDFDIVNMWMARVAQAPVLLVGDIDRGGVLASLLGTLALLTADERRHVRGMLINKFRGDQALLMPGIREIERRMGLPCLGVIPYWRHIQIPEEDAIEWRRLEDERHASASSVTIGIVDAPCLSNFTDFDGLAREPDVRLVRIPSSTETHLDALIFPGTKHTAQALRYVNASGIDRVARRVHDQGGMLLGICGGYQILGRQILDPEGVESSHGPLDGLGLLDVITTFAPRKVIRQVHGVHRESGRAVHGYEIHMGQTTTGRSVASLFDIKAGEGATRRPEGAVSEDGQVWGTYLHGLFDHPEFRRAFLNRLREHRGWPPLDPQPENSLEHHLDKLADLVQSSVELPAVEAMIHAGV
jgi:adenosylcobyric acid synthase